MTQLSVRWEAGVTNPQRITTQILFTEHFIVFQLIVVHCTVLAGSCFQWKRIKHVYLPSINGRQYKAKRGVNGLLSGDQTNDSTWVLGSFCVCRMFHWVTVANSFNASTLVDNMSVMFLACCTAPSWNAALIWVIKKLWQIYVLCDICIWKINPDMTSYWPTQYQVDISSIPLVLSVSKLMQQMSPQNMYDFMHHWLLCLIFFLLTTAQASSS